MRSRLTSLWIEQGGLLAVASLLLYAVIAPTYLSTGDNAEFAALGELGGAAHPSGYPLYVLWLRLWSWLPAETPAHAAALATCVLGALTVLAVHAACRSWGAGPVSASWAAALVGAAPIAVRLHSEAEVFALNGLVAAIVLWLAGGGAPVRGARRVIALGLVAGLGMSNHLTCVFLAPVGIYGVVRGLRESRSTGAALGAAIAAFVVGLAPYVYLLAAPETRASWGSVEGAGGLLHHVLRMDYGGPGRLGPVDLGGEPGANVLALAGTHLRAWLWLPFGLGLATLVVRSTRAGGPHAESRVAWASLAASWLVAGPIFVSRFNLDPGGVHAFLTRRFHLLPLVVFAVPVAVGLAWVGAWVRDRSASAILRSRAAGVAGATLTMVALAVVALPRIAAARSPAIEQAVKNMLRTLPRDAVVIGTPDEFHFGMGYLQGALGERPDVVTITWQLVGLPHVRARVRRELGITIEELPPGSTEKLSVVVAEQILASGRPLFIDTFQGNVAASFPCYPYGLLYRVLPRGTPLPSLEELDALNRELYARYELGYEFPHEDDLVPAELHRRYAATWHVIADAFTRAGRAHDAAEARKMAAALSPRAQGQR